MATITVNIPMTWADFKAWVQAQGVLDTDIVDAISFNPDQVSRTQDASMNWHVTVG